MRKIVTVSLLVTSVFTSASAHGQTQQAAKPFTQSSTIHVEPLDPGRTKTLESFIKLPPTKQNRSALTDGFCKPLSVPSTPSPDQVQLALALVESEIVPIFSFERPSQNPSKPDNLLYSVEFGLGDVTLRSSNPRYQSQAAGIRVAYPRDTTSPVWFEAKGSGSILFLVPPVKDCSVQFVVACPRTYSNARALEESKLSLTGVKYLVGSKADGLFKAPSGQEGKVVASTLASSRVTLPSSWFSQNVSSESPNASVKIQTPPETLSSEGAFISAAPPFSDAVEAHLEFGTTSSLQRTVRARTTIEVSPFRLETPYPVRVERSEVPLNPGSCIVISRRKEIHY
jgi:hypothetical protein